LDAKGYVGETCASEEELTEFFINSHIVFVYLYKVFDESILTSNTLALNQKTIYKIYDKDKSYIESILVNKNEIILKDSWLYHTIGVESKTFYDISLGDTSTGALVPGIYDPIYIRIVQSEKEFTITRTRENLLTILSEIGGFIKIVTVGIAWALAPYVDSLYLDSIMGSLFKIQRNLIKKKTVKKTRTRTRLDGVKQHFHSRLLSSLINRLPF